MNELNTLRTRCYSRTSDPDRTPRLDPLVFGPNSIQHGVFGPNLLTRPNTSSIWAYWTEHSQFGPPGPNSFSMGFTGPNTKLIGLHRTEH